MRRLLARILRIPDREERLLENAMRATPRPVPPDGLRERLLADALEAAQRTTPRPRKSRRWVALTASAAVVAVVLAWVILSSHGSGRVGPTSTGGQMSSAPAKSHPSQPQVSLPSNPKKGPPAHHPVRKPKRRSRPAPIRHESPSETVLVENPPAEAPALKVEVSHTREGDVGYAQAAGWNADGVRTEWTSVEDGEMKHKTCMADDAGPRLCLTVSLPNSLGQRMEDNL